MFLLDLFRSFLPLHNPFGFGVADFLEFAVAALLVGLLLLRTELLQRMAGKPRLCVSILFLLPIVLRLVLLPHYPVPTPAGSDDFSYLLLGDTLAHFRLANPPHPLHQFFESIFVLQQPSYSSIFPLGQGMALAAGTLIFGFPWAGVLISVGMFCAVCYWMLRAWTTPVWALTGGLLTVAQFGPLNSWMNNYWGGAVSAIAGCLVFGALPRLRDRTLSRDALILGCGLALQLLTRPFEFLLLLIAIAAFLPSFLKSTLKNAKSLIPALLVLIPAVFLMLAHNKAVTGRWTELPYMESRIQYGVPASFTFQTNPQPQRTMTAEQQLDYEAQSAIHDSSGNFWPRFLQRISFYRFFFLAPLYLAIPMFFVRPYWWILFTLLLFAIGTNFYPYFYPHYIAAVTCLFVLMSVVALERLLPVIRRPILLLCSAHFLFWYGIHALGNADIRRAMVAYEPIDFVNLGDPDGRTFVNNTLALAPGKQLVFVHYWPQHRFKGWIQNGADIDSQPVVWAADISASENKKLLAYYRDRTIWVLEPDARPPKLSRVQRMF